MAPTEEAVGIGDQETTKRIINLSERMGSAVYAASTANPLGADRLKVAGLVFEPSEGNVHLIVADESEKKFALGGHDSKNRYPIDQSDGLDPKIHWGGLAESRPYLLRSTMDGVFVKADNQLGIDFKMSGIPTSKDKADASIVFLFDVDKSKSLGDQSMSVVEQLLSTTLAERPEVLDKITVGLEKAGMPPKLSAPQA